MDDDEEEEERTFGMGETQRKIQDTTIVVPPKPVTDPTQAVLGGGGNAPATGAAVEEDGMKVAVDEKDETDI